MPISCVLTDTSYEENITVRQAHHKATSPRVVFLNLLVLSNQLAKHSIHSDIKQIKAANLQILEAKTIKCLALFLLMIHWSFKKRTQKL